LVPDILSSTHLGKVWYLGSVALIALFATVIFAGRKDRAVAGVPFALSLVLIACAKAASGHAAGKGDFSLAEFSMFLHVAGTAVWAGTVILSGLIVLPALGKGAGSELWSYAGRLSATVTWALAIILLSGLFTSYTELDGKLSGLWTSGWGIILLTKVAFVALALALGAFTRFKCVQRPAAGERAELMVRLVRAEAFVMMAILCLSGLLANTAPAMSETRVIPAVRQFTAFLATYRC
jgi:putative copper resistance protein D